MKGNTFQLIDFPHFTDPKGETVPFEFSDIPFTPKRSYVFTGVPNLPRGGHAHIVEQEVFVAVQGQATARIHDGEKWHEIRLNKKNQGIYIPTYVWHEFVDFSDDALLMALTSTPYLPGDSNYICDFDAFLSHFHRETR